MAVREITTHRVGYLNDEIRIQVLDEPGPGGANHRYQIGVPFLNPVEAYPAENSRRARANCDIHFQEGGIAQAGMNGITNEALLAVVEDRLSCFQGGPFACEENANALAHVRLALDALHSRTRDRILRGVEGTHQK